MMQPLTEPLPRSSVSPRRWIARTPIARGSYTDDVGSRRPVGEDERLVSRAQAGDEAARARLLEENQGLVNSVARKIHCATMDPDDLMQEGILGLARAVDMFDSQRGLRFSTYAVPWIRQAILRAIDNNARLIRIPVNSGYTALRVQRAKAELTAELGRAPSAEEIAAVAGVPPRRVPKLLDSICETVSFDGGGDGVSRDYADPNVPTPEAVVLARAEQETVRRMVKSLPEQERSVIERRFGLGGNERQTLQQLAHEFSLTLQGVRRIEARALTRLRAAFAEMGNRYESGADRTVPLRAERLPP